ncbi:MAG: MBL fold metallo-hydrolase [Candidatus Bathyarchaeia archaeon]|jgi:glyoxylase-like metal-dependent hydrolase (beta-lactamase superfamily II)
MPTLDIKQREKQVMLQTKFFEVGRLATNCYIVNCPQTQEAAVIDPGFDTPQEAESICAYINRQGLKPTLIINTHGHPDHTCGNAAIKQAYNIPIAIHHADKHMLGATGKTLAYYFGYSVTSPPADKILHENDVIKIGKQTLTVIHTPGHTQGSITLQGKTQAYTGDTLFAGSIGRTDFPESDSYLMQQTLKKLQNLLDDAIIIYPGHGPPTTMRQEKQVNPFLANL